MKHKTILLAALLSLTPAAFAAGPTHEAHGWLRHFDSNGDGVVSKDEAQKAAQARVDQTFEKLDTNRDGQITQEEVRAVREARRAEMQAKFQERFTQADTNGDGLLSKEEAKAGMPMLSRGFDRMDTNKDGQLSSDELKAAGEHFRHRHGWRHHRPMGPSDTSQDAPTLR